MTPDAYGPAIGGVINAVCSAYNLHISQIRKPESKRGNKAGPRKASDARIAMAYLLLRANVPLKAVCHLLNYSYNQRRGYIVRSYHKLYMETDNSYLSKYLAAERIIAPAETQPAKSR